MASNKVGIIIAFAVGLLLLGILLPMGLDDLTAYTGEYTYTSGTVTTATAVNSTMGTLVGTILPVLIVIGIILAMLGGISRKGHKGEM